MDLLTFLMQFPDFSDRSVGREFALAWEPKRIAKGSLIVRQDDADSHEFIVLDGCVASRIGDPDGKDICVGLYVGPCIVTPNIARTRDGASLVSMEAVTDVLIAQTSSVDLTDRMIVSASIRDWANGVLRDELSRKADREWCLAALRGAERLTWFRQKFPGYENVFTHSLIASYLGVTPVTLSRLRTKHSGEI